jgi:hypothetical protein
MKALVWRGGNLLALESIPEPESGPGEVVVQVVLAGICGSDLHAYRGHDTARTPPLVLGHEAVARTPNGSRAAIYPLIGCGACDACRRGHYAYEHGDFDAAISLLATAAPAARRHAHPATGARSRSAPPHDLRPGHCSQGFAACQSRSGIAAGGALTAGHSGPQTSSASLSLTAHLKEDLS